MTQKQLEVLGGYWQGLMRLRDWDIKFNLVPYCTLQAFGESTYNSSIKTATVSVCIPGQEPAAGGGQPYDPEQTLVHELLHIQFWQFGGLERGSEKQVCFEQGVDLTAWALVRAQRT